MKCLLSIINQSLLMNNVCCYEYEVSLKEIIIRFVCSGTGGLSLQVVVTVPTSSMDRKSYHVQVIAHASQKSRSKTSTEHPRTPHSACHIRSYYPLRAWNLPQVPYFLSMDSSYLLQSTSTCRHSRPTMQLPPPCVWDA